MIKPILFNADMVRSLLANRKTATRRVVKGYTLDHLELDTDGSIIGVYDQFEGCVRPVMDYAPYRPSDILYVRETWAPLYPNESSNEVCGYIYKADPLSVERYDARFPNGKDYQWEGRWRPSIHMPREAARIFLRATDVRVERLQDTFFERGSTIFSLRGEGIDIGEQCRECIEAYGSPCCIDAESECGILDEVRGGFSDLWDSTIKKKDRALYGWAANPWVWVIEFEQISREEAI